MGEDPPLKAPKRRGKGKAYWNPRGCRQTVGNDGARGQRLSDGRLRETRARPMLVRLCDGTLRGNWQTTGNCGTQSQRRRGGSLHPTLVRLHGKPRETAGRKARGYRVRKHPKLVRLHGKPAETPGRKAMGPKGRPLRGEPPEFVLEERIEPRLWQPGYRTSLRPSNAKKGRMK